MPQKNVISEKMRESVASVLPVTLIVAVLCLLFIPISSGLMLSFFIGSIMIIVGMGLFSLGSDISMTQIGTHIGSKMTKSRKLWLILLLSFILGFIITLAEPDLQVLASNAPAIDTTVLIITVSVGVGLFLLVSMLRILFSIPLKWLLIVFYGAIFVLAAFSDSNFLSVAFDSGGVTTGPITVPFIMALGVGVASIRSDEKAKSDSFGLVALCSIGPILAVLLLGFIYKDSSDASASILVNDFADTVELGHEYLRGFPVYMKEVAVALLPIFAFFILFQIFSLRLKKRPLVKIIIGIVYTYIGLVLFLTGVNVGFSSLGYVLGEVMVEKHLKYLLIPIAMLMGWFIINAEPAVHVLNKQVEELSAGAISEKAMGLSLSVAISLAMGLAMIRVLFGISILWFMVPGYILALGLTFFVPQTFTAIAFDSGGVASGPLTATFMLPFAMGACSALGGNIMTDAFGLVALVAMMPLITVQIMGVIYVVKSRRVEEKIPLPEFADDEIIELWEL
ncbi:MAG: DUF1538 domain-containing protein [Eubacteriales bacterium]